MGAANALSSAEQVASCVRLRHKGVTEMRPGTYVFRDTMGFRYGVYGPDRCAARFYSTVVSHAAPDRCIVDAGSKTLAADMSKGHPGHGFIVGHPGAIIYHINEEHGSVSIPEDDPGLELGDHVEIIPNHVCPAVNLHDEMLIIRDGNVDLGERHKGTRMTEFFSVRLLGFNKAVNELHFVSGAHIREVASDMTIEIIDQTKFTSNVIFVLRKKSMGSVKL